MSSKAIREYDGKLLLERQLEGFLRVSHECKLIQVRFDENTSEASIIASLHPTGTSITAHGDHHDMNSTHHNGYDEEGYINRKLNEVERNNPWVKNERLVVKPDQLIKRRGKSGLLALNLSWEEAKEWIRTHAFRSVKVDSVEGNLKVFLIEPFIPHNKEDEHYVCIQSVRDGDEILFSERGGVDIGDVDSHAHRLLVPINTEPQPAEVFQLIKRSSHLTDEKKEGIVKFILELFKVYNRLYFTYLEINPLVCLKDGHIYALDLAAKLDSTAEYEVGSHWKISKENSVEFPSPFGRELSLEEKYVAELDSKTGASLKFTLLNADGRVWTLVAGGGASVVYTDAITGLGFASELANYGEYSGAPSESQTYEYTKTILDLMTRPSKIGRTFPDGKVLIIGGGIANFTNVATTFKGIISALSEYALPLQAIKAHIWVRRAGPNYQEGLRMMKEAGETLNLPIFVFGPETHMTEIVTMALKGSTEETNQQFGGSPSLTLESFKMSGSPIENSNPLMYRTYNSSSSLNSSYSPRPSSLSKSSSTGPVPPIIKQPYELFTTDSRAFIYGMQPKAVQGMLDFDLLCRRSRPSVAAIVYSYGGGFHLQKFYWGSAEILIPVYSSVHEAMEKHTDVDVVINFASCRSVYESVLEVINADTKKRIKVMSIIAEGVPERRTKQITLLAAHHGMIVIGPATVGGIKAGAFKIGNTGGMIDNILASKLYRRGSVAYISKSGGMSNELNNLISRTTNGVYEGIAIGGDRYPCTTFLDHALRLEKDPKCKMLLILGEIGGVEEYKLVDAIKDRRVTKPMIAWCIGTCSNLFNTEVQFGHAGACASSDLETALAKNEALRAVGALVPSSFEEIPSLLFETYSKLVADGTIIPEVEIEPPKVPIDYSWAQELGLIRKPANFISSICDDRGPELIYAGMPISAIFKEDIGVGGVLSLLWFRRRLPDYAAKFIEMILMLTADHGPAVSGAHNTIVTARAGKDLISSLVSGLLTIGDRFGGASDGAAEQFSKAYDQGLSPLDFVESMRRQHTHILGIGHKIKSRTNPDLRVSILIDYAKRHFRSTTILDYALQVEKITTAKKENLILNVDGAIGVLFVDLLRGCGAFSSDEAQEYIKIGTLNGLFVLGRSMGFIGHYLDQKRLKQGLYRHPWDDISYMVGQDLSPSGNTLPPS